MLKVHDCLAIQIPIASGAALQTLFFKFSDPLSENSGSAPEYWLPLAQTCVSTLYIWIILIRLGINLYSIS